MNSQLPRRKIILRPRPPRPPTPPKPPSTPPPKPRVTRPKQPPNANTNLPVCSDFIKNLRLEPTHSVEITSYCQSLTQMPLSAAVVGLGLESDRQSATALQNYLRSDHGLPPMAVELKVLNWLAPPFPLPSLWQATAVKCLISGVQRGESLLDVHTHPDQTRYLVLAGWTQEQAEMVIEYDYGPPSPLIVRPSSVAEDPFVDDGEGDPARDVMDGFKVSYLYGRDCPLPNVLLPRERQPRFVHQTPSRGPRPPREDVHEAPYKASGNPEEDDAVQAVVLHDLFAGGVEDEVDDDDEGSPYDVNQEDDKAYGKYRSTNLVGSHSI